MFESNSRRLPVYLVIDTSGSMMGDPISSVDQGIRAVYDDLMADPRATETAYLSVITFNAGAQQVCPLTSLPSFTPPTLQAGGPTYLGEALSLLEKCIDTEVRRAGPDQQGDYRPLIFLMTDGAPNDSWEEAATRVRSRRFNIIACGAGPQADTDVLRKITDQVLHLKDLQPDDMRAFFKWVSSSVKQTSQVIQQAAPDAPVGLPPTPPGFTIIP